MSEQELAGKWCVCGHISPKQKTSRFLGMTSHVLQTQQKSGARSSSPPSPSTEKPGVEK